MISANSVTYSFCIRFVYKVLLTAVVTVHLLYTWPSINLSFVPLYGIWFLFLEASFITHLVVLSTGEDGRALLQKYINKPRNDMKTALLLAAEMGYTAVINFLIEEGADLSLKSSTKTSLLHLIASFGNVDAVRSLLEKGVSHNVEDSRRRTPLHE